MNINDTRLIESGFPCHQVGAETQRERGMSTALPANFALHVWWARRPLTPSRAAIVASLDSADTDPETFVRQLGIERCQALVNGEPWNLTGDLLGKIVFGEKRGNGETENRGQNVACAVRTNAGGDCGEYLPVDAVVLRRLRDEEGRRAENRELIAKIKSVDSTLANDPVLKRWEVESKPLPGLEDFYSGNGDGGALGIGETGNRGHLILGNDEAENRRQSVACAVRTDGAGASGDAGDGGGVSCAQRTLRVRRVMGDPAWAKGLMDLTKKHNIRFPGDAYCYSRAFTYKLEQPPSGLTVLDPTSGGGSIPFEALRLGHNVIANELNPVATTILYGTLDYPARFGASLSDDVELWGKKLLNFADTQNSDFFADGMLLPKAESEILKLYVESSPELYDQYNKEQIADYIFARQVTCPH